MSEPSLERLIVHSITHAYERGIIECQRCHAVAFIPNFYVSTIQAAAQAHLAECPTPHEEPPPAWRDMVRGDRDE